MTIKDVQVPPLILADSAYPMRQWMVTPFKGSLNVRQALFNQHHSRARCMVERTFGRLKGRWQCFALQLPVEEENISSCVILHNLVEPSGLEFILPTDELRPLRVPLPKKSLSRAEENTRLEEASKVCEALTTWMQQRARR